MSTTDDTQHSRDAARVAAALEAQAAVLDANYRAPFWLPGAHIQTIVPALFARLPSPTYRRERWDTPDGDFIEVDWVDGKNAGPNAPLFVLFHGLEGGSGSHYARSLAAAAHARGWHAAIPHFRSCSGPLNLLPRFYHLADSAEVDWVLRRLAARHADGTIELVLANLSDAPREVQFEFGQALRATCLDESTVAGLREPHAPWNLLSGEPLTLRPFACVMASSRPAAG